MKFRGSSNSRLVVLGLLLSITLMPVFAHGQQFQTLTLFHKLQQFAPPTHFASGNNALGIPFELTSNVIFLQVRVNGSEPLWFVLDTGAPGTVLDTSRAKMLGIKVSGGGNIEGAGENTAAAGMAKDVPFNLTGLDFQAREIAVLPLSNLN